MFDQIDLDLGAKQYFKIGEVGKILDIKPYVLRYWEEEFPEIKPIKTKANQRVYKRKDVYLLFQIRELLYDKKYTIAGARKELKERKRTQHAKTQNEVNIETIEIKESPLPPEASQKKVSQIEENRLRDLANQIDELIQWLDSRPNLI